MITHLKDAALGLKLVMQPEIIMTDFEIAAMNAFTYHFPMKKALVVFLIYVKAYLESWLTLVLKPSMDQMKS